MGQPETPTTLSVNVAAWAVKVANRKTEVQSLGERPLTHPLLHPLLIGLLEFLK